MYVAIYYLMYTSANHYSVDLVRNIIIFSSQQIRNTFTLILFERIVATVKLENYTMADSNVLLWRLTSSSYAISLVYFGYNVYAKTLPDIPFLYNPTTYYAYSAQIFMLSVCAILYLMNRRMYSLSAYKINLKRRYTISQNVKCLAYLFPSVIIYASLAQTGSMISIIVRSFNLPTPSSGLTHIFFNLSYLMIYFRHYSNHSDEKITEVQTVTTVKNPLGKHIPKNVSMDKYFHDLQHRWI